MDHSSDRSAAHPTIPLGEFASLVNARIRSEPGDELPISGISLVSTKVNTGDLFAALPGVHTHGLRFVGEALAHGAVAVLTDPEGAGACAEDGVPILEVYHPRSVLGTRAAD